MNQSDPDSVRLARVGEDDLGAVNDDRPGVGSIESCDAFHQRGLAGSILAEQGVERSGRLL